MEPNIYWSLVQQPKNSCCTKTITHRPYRLTHAYLLQKEPPLFCPSCHDPLTISHLFRIPYFSNIAPIHSRTLYSNIYSSSSYSHTLYSPSINTLRCTFSLLTMIQYVQNKNKINIYKSKFSLKYLRLESNFCIFQEEGNKMVPRGH